MKSKVFAVLLLCVLFLGVTASSSFALGIEIAAGAWQQDPEGTISYKPLSGTDNLDIDRDLKYDEKTKVFGRLKIDMPALLPNLYVLATPMSFDGTGDKNVQFTFGNQTFDANVDFFSKADLDHLDVALYYGLPFVKTATLGVLNLDLGINVRVVDFEAKVDQQATGLSESKSFTIAIPMLYAAAQVEPVDWLALEAEGRGVTYSGDHVFSFIGRVKVKPVKPLPFFIAGGWRHEDIDVDEEDVVVDVTVSGPFAEAGIEF
jgi:outer membrane protein